MFLPNHSNQRFAGSFFAALLAVGTLLPLLSFAAPDPDADSANPKTPGDASVRPETDDPTARREYMKAWYETPFTPAYMKWLNQSAQREGATNADLLPPLPADDVTANDTGAPGTNVTKTWVNLGPKKADFIKN